MPPYVLKEPAKRNNWPYCTVMADDDSWQS
jgi:hypothetical protein